MAGTWEEVRRTLGRLIGRASVREITPQTRSLTAEVRHSQATEPLTASAGHREGNWRPETHTTAWPLPAAQDGGAGMDLASVRTVVRANGALAAQAAEVHCPPWRVEGGASIRWRVGDATLPTPAVWDGAVRYPLASVHSGPKQIETPRMHSFPIRPVVLERKKRKPEPPAWRIRPPRAHSAPDVMARVPITRTSLAPPPGTTTAAAFAAERQQLAEATGVPETDVLLVGLFPQVPLNLVQRLAVVAEGGIRLQIWLKPDALTSARKPVKSVTIILGRQRSTGRVLQTVAKTAAPEMGNR